MSTDIETSILALGNVPPSELAEQALKAQALGFTRLWHADERFFRDPWATLSYLAAKTSTLQYGVCVTDPYIRHPALTARAYGTLDEIAENRVTLGLGVGVSGFAELGISRERPMAAMRDSVGLIRALLAGKTVDLDGEVISFRDGRLDFDRRSSTRIFIASNGPKMLRLAGELADGVIVQGLASKEMVESVRALVAEGAERGGRDPGEVRLVARIDTCIDQDGDAARERMKPGLVRHLRTHHPRYNSFELAQLEVPDELRKAVGEIRYGFGGDAAAEVERQIPDEYVNRFCLAGTVDDVSEHFGRLQALGVDEVMIRPLAVGNASPEGVIEIFAREVVPSAR